MTTPASDADERAGARIYNQVQELEKQLKRARGPDARAIRSKLRDKLVEVILTDYKLSEERHVDATLWHTMFYVPYSELRNRIASSAENQQLNLQKLRNFLTDGEQFYLALVRKLRKKYGISQDTLLEPLSGDQRVAEYRKFSHGVYVHLGDLARYKQQYIDGRPDFKVPAGYYYKAIELWPSAGHPHNQLAVLATYMHDDFNAVYHYFRSLGAIEPFDTATANLTGLFQKNLEERNQKGQKTKIEDSSGRRAFFGSFIKLIAMLHLKKSLDKLSGVCSETVTLFEKFSTADPDNQLSLDLQNVPEHANGLASVAVQIAAMLICSINYSHTSESNTYADALQYSSTSSKFPLVTAFKIATSIMSRTKSKDSPLLAASLVFMEWLACKQDLAGGSSEEQLATARTLFWKETLTVLNSLCDDEASLCPARAALWEDRELRGFKPLAAVHSKLDFSRRYGSVQEETRARVRRFIEAGKTAAELQDGPGKGIVFDADLRKFILEGERREMKLQEKVRQPSEKVNSPLPCQPVLSAPPVEDEEEVILFKPIKVTPTEKVPASNAAVNRTSTSVDQAAFSAISAAVSQASTAAAAAQAAAVPPSLIPPQALHASMMNGISGMNGMNGINGMNAGAGYPSANSVYPGYAGYGYPLAEHKTAVVTAPPPASHIVPGTYSPLDDLLYQLQNAAAKDVTSNNVAFRDNTSAFKEIVEASFSRQQVVNHVPNDPPKASEAVRASLRPPPGFGPLPSRAGNKAVAQPPLRGENNAGWSDRYPGKLSSAAASARPLFGADFGIWANNNSNGLPISMTTSAPYPFPGMGVRTQPTEQVFGKPPQQPQFQQQQQQQQQQEQLRQYHPPDPFVS